MGPTEHARRRSPASAAATRRHITAWLAYVAFVVYGSLVPLDFHPLPLEQAWAAFRQLPMLQIGIEGRADWVANGVLYVPVGFLTLVVFGGRNVSALRPLPIIGAILFCLGLDVAVEFTQLFFPARTVSRNDVLAEGIGSALGIVVALHGTKWYHDLVATLHGALDQFGVRLLEAYAIGYLGFAFFPFDFVLSAAEFATKVDSDSWGWLLARHSTDRGVIVLAAKLTAETLAVLPLGLMLGRWNIAKQAPATRHAVLLGIILGLTIELGQFFVFSGVSQGISLLTRAVGMYGGALLWQHRKRLGEPDLSAGSNRLVAPLVLLYLLGLVAVNGWFDHSWQDVAAAGNTFAQTRFLPFYYHYFTTEQAALVSLISVALMYAPLGVLGWIRWWSPAVALWVAAIVAAGIESSKLFLAGLHPDPTNILIGGLAAWSVTRLMQQLRQSRLAPAEGKSPEEAVVVPAAVPAPAAGAIGPPARAMFALLATLLLTAWVAIDFPVFSLLLGTLLASYAVLLWFKPQLLWAAIPAAIPLLDLAPWSGRFYLDEFDFFIMISLVIGYARTQAAARRILRDRTAAIAWSLLVFALAIATLRGLWPLPIPDANSFSSYYSPYNALRIVKGALWAIMLLALMPRFAAGSREIGRLFANGMVVGLAGTVAVVIWERMIFPGALNFTDVYRVTGPFSQMHTGGADLETWLTAALPFAMLVLASSRSLVVRLGCAVLLLGATYAVMVTFSRAGYAGFGVALVLVSLAVWRGRGRSSAAEAGSISPANPGRTTYRLAAPLVLIALVLAVAVPIFSASFAQERMSRLGSDFAIRQAHWRDALAIRDPGLGTAMFGMGIGRFPETHYWRSTEPKAASYRLETVAGNIFLRLGAGYPLYVEQSVAIEPHREYTLQLDIRSPQPAAGVSVSLCEKWLLTSAHCVMQTASVTEPGVWQSYQLRLVSDEMSGGPWLTRPPVKFSIYNPSTATVDVDNVRLLTLDGEEVVHNGDFSHGLDRWFFSVDQDLPWHVWSMPVAILFDQGWFGLAAFGVVLLIALKRSAQNAWRGDLQAGAVFASLVGILVIAALDTIVDAPRFLLLLLLLGWMGTKSSAARSP